MIGDAKRKFQHHFGGAHTSMGVAPGRVNLIGEHVDYNGGTVLPMALSCQSVALIAPVEGDTLQIKSDRYDEIVERSIGDTATGHWSDLVVGTLQKAQSLGLSDTGFSIYIDSTVPQGAGVSSSASLATALLRALIGQSNLSYSPEDIAKTARAVENDYMCVPCGIMDQMAVGLLASGEALALNTKDLSSETILVPEDWAFCVLHSGIHRQLTDGRYKERFLECEHAARQLDVKDLCDGDLAALGDLPDSLMKRARHVITENQRACFAVQAMKQSDFEAFGGLMDESHESYSQDFEASTPEIDTLVETARAEGAIGARLTGGGFGGCIVCLVHANEAKDWTARMLEKCPQTWCVE